MRAPVVLLWVLLLHCGMARLRAEAANPAQGRCSRWRAGETRMANRMHEAARGWTSILDVGSHLPLPRMPVAERAPHLPACCCAEGELALVRWCRGRERTTRGDIHRCSVAAWSDKYGQGCRS